MNVLKRWLGGGRSKPAISFVVIAYDMQREVPRTVQSLGRDYQQGSEDVDYEVIVVDNGSPEPLDLSSVGDIGVPLRLLRRDNASPSPAEAVNVGVDHASGHYVAVMIDGARMLSPGVVRGASDAIGLAEQPVIAVLGLHLGPGHQRQTVRQGYSKAVEDELLASIKWPADGYRLFHISAWGGSCQGGWFDLAAESNCIVVSRRLYEALDGYDECFEMLGGGLVNLDFYKRAVEHPRSTLIYLAGEGCFHQLHGGVTTQPAGHSFEALNEEYTRLRGAGFETSPVKPLLYGKLHPVHAPAILSAAEWVMEAPSLQTVQAWCEPFMKAAEKKGGGS